jgi:peptidoglycan/xylan/chitin deacetylase (PgdA/CDA1 family)
VSVSNYTDGDAKWYFNPTTTLQKGKQYRFTTWYKSNVIPKAVAMFVKADGTEQYFGMPNPQPPANSATVWQKYTETFSVPQDAVSTSVFLFANQNGWVQTDDYSITDYTPTPFTRSLLSLTFDDGFEENVTNALPVLNQKGFKTTQCFASSFIENDPVQANTNVMAFFQSGHEICSHTVTHPFLTAQTPANLTYELQHSQQYLQSVIGQPVKNFASPYGDYNAAVNTEIKKYYRSHRTVDEGYNSKDNFDLYRVRVQNILSSTTAAQVNAWVQQAQTDKTWLVLVYHRVSDTDPGPFDSKIADFKAQMDAIQASGITIKTYDTALDELTAQL